MQSFAPAQKVLSAISLVVEYHTDVERRLRLRQALPLAINPKAWTFNLDELWPMTYESFLSAVAKDHLQAAGDVNEPMGMSLTSFREGLGSLMPALGLFYASGYVYERLRLGVPGCI